MKVSKFATLLVLGLIVATAATGCRKKPGYLTPLPGTTPGTVGDVGPGAPLDTGKTTGSDIKPEDFGGITSNQPGAHFGWLEDASMFKQDTVYFDFDSSAIKSGEKSKIASVADYLKGNTKAAVRVEGHCDERGTEEYNRALGERRALAIREELVRLGIDPTRVDTLSYGEDRPAVQGHDESAWRLNRRGEFILLTPP
ncbi:MAG TPA: OmpA family protein [Candidatus Paceibacterota bacterium]|jgi:peptidoglycan-associated lipoprotein|nr:OmpA family protein [Candidatus Paceibacterota bacterium]